MNFVKKSVETDPATSWYGQPVLSDHSTNGGSLVRIFMEGQEEWLEPCGEVMVVIAKLMMGGAFVAFSWAAIVRLMGLQASVETAGLSKPAISAIVLSSVFEIYRLIPRSRIFLPLSVAFWLAGRFFKHRITRLPAPHVCLTVD